MASNPGFIIVWEYEVRPCLWIPYKPKLCQSIENAFRSSNGKINLGIFNQELACFEINFVKQKEKNIYTKESRRVRQKQYPFSCILAKGILWAWWCDFSWEPYDVPTMMYIESEYQKQQHGVDLTSSPLAIPNIIDFTSMAQMNKITKKNRPIKRVTTSEQYPLAVFKSQSMTTATMLAPQGTASGHQHSKNPPPVHNSMVQQVVTSKHQQRPKNNLPVQNMVQQVPMSKHQHHKNPPLAHNNMVQQVLASGYQQHPKNTPPIHNNMVSHSRRIHSNKGLISAPQPDPALQNLINKMKYIPQGSPTTSGGPLVSFTIPVKVNGQVDDECAICLENLMTPSDYDLLDPGMPEAEIQCVSPDVVKLMICKHMFHRMCLQKMYSTGDKNGCLQCPTCKTIHGIKRGNQPKDGIMDIKRNSVDIPGYPGYGSIVITYKFKSGLQGENHPNPGQRYVTNGFPRTCFLPNNIKGQKVLTLLQKAFERQLTFTIGTSVTTGLVNTVTWNDIHHKTEGYQDSTGYGYPDINYLDNVIAELATHGITDENE